MRFIGDFPAKADAKGRVFLPAAFRKVLEAEKEERLVLRTDLFQKCLVVYPESLWNEMLDEMRMRLNRWNGEHQMVMRRFVADAEIIELDSNGRILLNKRKKDYAGIKQEVRFLAVDDRIEIWDKATIDEMLKGGEETEGLGQDIANLMGF
jgi:MraZ protein